MTRQDISHGYTRKSQSGLKITRTEKAKKKKLTFDLSITQTNSSRISGSPFATKHVICWRLWLQKRTNTPKDGQADTTTKTLLFTLLLVTSDSESERRHFVGAVGASLRPRSGVLAPVSSSVVDAGLGDRPCSSAVGAGPVLRRPSILHRSAVITPGRQEEEVVVAYAEKRATRRHPFVPQTDIYITSN